MTTQSLTISGTGSYLPESRADLGAAAERYPDDSERILSTGYQCVCTEDELYPADMALIASQRALAAAGVKPEELDLLVFTSIHRHGHKRLWSPASWLQSQLGCGQAMPLVINQGCNGQLLAMEMASKYLGENAHGTALVVAADRFSASDFNRFTADYGIVYGDAAAAAVLTSRPAVDGWRVLTTHRVSAPELEGLHRADAPMPESPELLGAEHDVRAAKRRFLAENGRDRLQICTREAVSEIMQAVLPEGDHPRLRRIIYPNLGLELLEGNYFPEFPGGAERSYWDFGRTVGHLGSGDQIAGLDHLSAREEFSSGDRVLLLGAGAGFSWTGMLLERS